MSDRNASSIKQKRAGKVIIDCDPGIDDALALMLACGSPEIDLLAVTAVCGNRSVEATALNAGRILNAAGRADVPVFAGCARPLAYGEPRCNLIHGEDGLGGVALAAGRATQRQHATDYIDGVLMTSPPGTVTIVAIGPLTNLAVAEVRNPGLLRRAAELLIMGGAAFCPGNVTPSAEFNFHADALAANTVLSAGARVRLFGLDVTTKAVISDGWIGAFAAMNTRCGRAAHDMLRAYALRDPKLHDACPVAYLLEPRIFSSEPCAVSVDWRPGPTEGHVTAWAMTRGSPLHAPNATVYTDVDRERLLALVSRRIAVLP